MACAIDWGNSNTVVAFRIGRDEHLLSDGAEGDNNFDLVPSFISYDEDGNSLAIGKAAKESIGKPGHYVVSGVKRLIGVSYGPEAVKVAYQYGVMVCDPEGDRTIRIKVGQTFKRPEEIAVDFFKRLRQELEEQARQKSGLFQKLFGDPFKSDQCVFTCPAHYDDAQKLQLMDCVVKAGFNPIHKRLFAEPVAASRLLPLQELKASRGILVIDWGGGTLDFAVAGEDQQCKYLDACRIYSGGIDMDLAILNGLQKQNQVPERLLPIDLAIVRHWIEKAKETLLGIPENEASGAQNIEGELVLPGSGKSLSLKVSPTDVRKWIDPVLFGGLNGIHYAVKRTANTWDTCVLVGGPITSPFIAQRIESHLTGKRVSQISAPMTAVARGALRLAPETENGPPPPKEILAHDYGVLIDKPGQTTGVLLLLAQTHCPCGSEEREMELHGLSDTSIKLAVWNRKIQSSDNSVEYYSSATFTFLPKFSDHNWAKIRVSLQADETGAISAKIADMANNKQLVLTRVGKVVSTPLDGPPCRSLVELNGQVLSNVWRDFTANENSDAPDIEGFIKQRLFGIGGETESSPAGLYASAKMLASRALFMLRQIPEPSSALQNLVNRVSSHRPTDENQPVLSDVASLVEAIERLHTGLVVGLGQSRIIPGLTKMNLHAKDSEFAGKVRELSSLMRNFTGDYQKLMNTWNVLKSELVVAGAPEEDLSIFGSIEYIVEMRNSLAHIKWRSR